MNARFQNGHVGSDPMGILLSHTLHQTGELGKISGKLDSMGSRINSLEGRVDTMEKKPSKPSEPDSLLSDSLSALEIGKLGTVGLLLGAALADRFIGTGFLPMIGKLFSFAKP